MQTQTENTPAGIGFMLLAMFFFVCLDAIAKYLMGFYPAVQVIWGRFFFHTILTLMVLLALRLNLRQKLVSKRPALQLARSLLMLATNGMFFLAIQTVDLTTATAIMFLSPIVMTVLAIPILGEQVGVRRWTGVLVGFVGAMVIVRPGVGEFEVAIGLLIVATITHAIYQIFTRQVREYDDPMTSLFYTGLVGMVIMSMIVPFEWQMPSLVHWPLFVALGLAGCFGHFSLIRALRVAPVSVVSPFTYSTLIWATGFSYILFDELPDLWVYLGAALIIVSGLYILYREQKAV